MPTTEYNARARFAEMRASLRLPVVVAPMFLVSGPDIVTAAARSGVIGSFPSTNARSLDTFEEWLEHITGELKRMRDQQVAGATDVWAQNLIVHSTYDRLDAELALLQKYQPPIVITALGSPKRAIEAVHDYGGLVIADVNSVELARKAAAAGADGLALVSAGAGGHTGQMAGFAFVPAVREFFDGILILAGAIGDGRAVRAAEILGAELSYMGTRFIATKESIAFEPYKQMVVDSDFSDLILTNSFSGAHAYYLRPSIVAAGLDPDNLPKKDGMDLTGSETKVKAWKDIWSAGQGIGTVHKVEPLADIVDRIDQEYRVARQLP
ncbi:MAG: nitronate monooxygenase family protein [Gammaproteobacteria bacterium]|nr:nitronate monooxygenase family protein [Gammaproteobacteria bacterium]MDH3372146.1 nitronate monooxygenase family protein [Gammaproteobacteria bacterium]MDH3408835.1 nitronate monooxygenase family protein [Gammaproteobacteria bacterium]MDH3551537.1 nitronate monooxygenase family protein [Gammaproteobacteria bacterium]